MITLLALLVVSGRVGAAGFIAVKMLMVVDDKQQPAWLYASTLNE
jgi:hypothetical protein